MTRKRIRPMGFVKYDEVLKVLERSIDSITSFAEIAGDFNDPEERIQEIQDLTNVIIELYWRYGGKVLFKFSQRRKFEDAVSLREMPSIHEEESTHWLDRIHIKEFEDSTSFVYIRF